jgi:hypothetical protein
MSKDGVSQKKTTLTGSVGSSGYGTSGREREKVGRKWKGRKRVIDVAKMVRVYGSGA